MEKSGEPDKPAKIIDMSMFREPEYDPVIAELVKRALYQEVDDEYDIKTGQERLRASLRKLRGEPEPRPDLRIVKQDDE